MIHINQNLLYRGNKNKEDIKEQQSEIDELKALVKQLLAK
jgi:hypothetical protein